MLQAGQTFIKLYQAAHERYKWVMKLHLYVICYKCRCINNSSVFWLISGFLSLVAATDLMQCRQHWAGCLNVSPMHHCCLSLFMFNCILRNAEEWKLKRDASEGHKEGMHRVQGWCRFLCFCVLQQGCLLQTFAYILQQNVQWYEVMPLYQLANYHFTIC